MREAGQRRQARSRVAVRTQAQPGVAATLTPAALAPERQGHGLRWVSCASARAGPTRTWEEPRPGAGQGGEPGPGGGGEGGAGGAGGRARARRAAPRAARRGARRGPGEQGTGAKQRPGKARRHRRPAAGWARGGSPFTAPRPRPQFAARRRQAVTHSQPGRSRVATTEHRETRTQYDALQLRRVNSVHRPLLTQQVSRQRRSRERRRLRPSLRYQGGEGRTGAFRGPCRPPSQSAPSPSAFPP